MKLEEFITRLDEVCSAKAGDETRKKVITLWADIEADRGIVVDWSKAPEWADTVMVAFCKGSDSLEGEAVRLYITHLTRPAPKYRELTLREKATRLHALPSEAMSAEFLSALKDSTIDDLCKAAGIETRVEYE